MTDADFRAMAKAVNRWLSFQIGCGREMLLSEAYLCQPLAEFLLHHHNGTLDTEYAHPQFSQGGRGRPRQVDFVLLSPETRALDVAIESKWIADRQYSKQAIVDDLLRLECLRQPGRYVRRYFLVAGRQVNFTEHFASVTMNAEGTRRPFSDHLLSFDTNDRHRNVSIRNCEPFRRPYYKSFSEDYGVQLPLGVRTHLLNVRTNDGIAVYLWKIESRKNRQTFDPIAEGW
jgi:hypothetical protein